jgi:rubrerythrin
MSDEDQDTTNAESLQVALQRQKQLRVALAERETEINELLSEILKEVKRKEDEADRASAEHDKEMAECQERLMAQSKRLRDAKARSHSLSRRNKRLLQHLKRYRCNLCGNNSHDTVTRCGHSFCNFCLEDWLRLTPTCPAPACKRPVSNDDIWRVYNEPGAVEVWSVADEETKVEDDSP